MIHWELNISLVVFKLQILPKSITEWSSPCLPIQLHFLLLSPCTWFNFNSSYLSVCLLPPGPWPCCYSHRIPASRSNLRSFGPLLWPSWVIHQFQDLSCACAHPVPSAPSSEQPESFLASFLSSHLKYNVPSWSPLALWQNQTPSSVLLQHTMCVNIPRCMVMQLFVYIYLNLLPHHEFIKGWGDLLFFLVEPGV